MINLLEKEVKLAKQHSQSNRVDKQGFQTSVGGDELRSPEPTIVLKLPARPGTPTVRHSRTVSMDSGGKILKCKVSYTFQSVSAQSIAKLWPKASS